MRDTVPLSPTDAVAIAFQAIDSSIRAGIDPQKAIASVAQRYDIDKAKLEELYVKRDTDGGGIS